MEPPKGKFWVAGSCGRGEKRQPAGGSGGALFWLDLNFSFVLYWAAIPLTGYKRLTPKQSVGLKHIGFVLTYKNHEMDSRGNIKRIIATYEPLSENNKPKVRVGIGFGLQLPLTRECVCFRLGNFHFFSCVGFRALSTGCLARTRIRSLGEWKCATIRRCSSPKTRKRPATFSATLIRCAHGRR